jgi:FkbM family methyltransferase
VTRLPIHNLVYDVGLFDGSDTAYYLHRGYSVVAIDANPQMIEAAKQKFADAISSGRLKLLNVGLSDRAGKAIFWVSDEPVWSSFNRDIASRDGKRHRAVDVPVVPFEDILAEHGVPFYLKVDIEGNDSLCIKALSRIENRPLYVSAESECVGDDERPSDEEALEMLHLLHDAGYRHFKLLDQSSRCAIRAGRLSSFRVRLIHNLAHGRLKRPIVSTIAAKMTDAASIRRRTKFDFAPGSSGPLGPELPGAWMTFDQAETVYLRERRRHFASRSMPTYSFWCDWHATV